MRKYEPKAKRAKPQLSESSCRVSYLDGHSDLVTAVVVVGEKVVTARFVNGCETGQHFVRLFFFLRECISSDQPKTGRSQCDTNVKHQHLNIVKHYYI